MKAIIGKDIQQAKAFLEQGNVVGIPTETVYGLAGNAFDIEAVTKIFEVKNRPTFDPLIVHTNNFERLSSFVQYIPEKAFWLAEKFMPGPLTMLLPKQSSIPDLVTSGLDTVAVRIPNHPLTLDLLNNLSFPLAAPSANPFGYISPTSAQHVAKQLGDKIPYVLDGGDCTVGIESTIVGFENDEVIVYRKGGLAIEEIEKVVGKIKVNAHSSSNPKAPGMLKSHYSPRKDLVIFTGEKFDRNITEIGYLAFQEFNTQIPEENQLILSPSGDYKEAAKHLFAFMRQLDGQENIEKIYVELLPEENLGRAINDRLRRAATKI
ncbi:MAG: L-threonylcarbamoyladenylate synthase [Arcicella sp.]|jgi:L-threonylcarbamoyladenylate synthase|nr:L-threonylcarbamoyladenylate synthase [Arcicella sp.]